MRWGRQRQRRGETRTTHTESCATHAGLNPLEAGGELERLVVEFLENEPYLRSLKSGILQWSSIDQNLISREYI